MKNNNKSEEKRILEVLKEFYQVSYSDLVIYFGYKKNSVVLLRLLQRLVREGKLKAITGIGQIYWRYNLPITTINRKQYKAALRTIDAYVRQMEGELKNS